MKKLILSALFAGAMFTAQAQTNLTGTAAASRAVLSMSAQDMSRQMYNELELNEGQYIKIKALNQKRYDRFSEIEKMYGNDPQMRASKISEVNTQLDQEFAQILNPKQFTSYLTMDGRPVNTGMNSTGTMNGSTKSTSVTGSSSTNMSAGSATGAMEGEMKVKDDKVKVESGSTKLKAEDNKMKVESASGEMKIKKDSEKLKTESVKYKSTPSGTKIISAQGKTKVEADKTKIKTETTKKKVKN